MPLIEWLHNRERLVLSAVLWAPLTAANANLSVRTTGLLDTGATATGIRADMARALQLRPKGQRRVQTANGLLIAPEYIIRIGFVPGDYRDPHFLPDQQQPYLLDGEFVVFGLQEGFGYPALIGMDVIGRCNLTLSSNGGAALELP